jgi:predicted Abi (CAAX) family protease
LILSIAKASTLVHVVKVADAFACEHSTDERQFMLAAGSAGIEAATNIVVREANRTMLPLDVLQQMLDNTSELQRQFSSWIINQHGDSRDSRFRRWQGDSEHQQEAMHTIDRLGTVANQ